MADKKRNNLLPLIILNSVQVRDEPRALDIIKVPETQTEKIIAFLPFLWRKVLVPIFLILGVLTVLTGEVVFVMLVIHESDTIGGRVMFSLLGFLPVAYLCILIIAPPFGWLEAILNYLAGKQRIGTLSKTPFKKFVIKFAEKKILTGWVIEYKPLRIAQQFYQSNPQGFQKTIEKAQTIEEFIILSGLRIERR